MQLKELQSFKYNILEKSKRSGVLLTVGGIFQRADTENANKRIYSKELWMDILQGPDAVERINRRRMVGMLGHPGSGKTDEEKISHVVTVQELRSNNEIYGEAEILDTPMGRITATMLEAAVSPRNRVNY